MKPENNVLSQSEHFSKKNNPPELVLQIVRLSFSEMYYDVEIVDQLLWRSVILRMLGYERSPSIFSIRSLKWMEPSSHETILNSMQFY